MSPPEDDDLPQEIDLDDIDPEIIEQAQKMGLDEEGLKEYLAQHLFQMQQNDDEQEFSGDQQEEQHIMRGE